MIRDGATLVRDAADVLAGIGLASAPLLPAVRKSEPADLLERAVLRSLAAEPRTFEELLDALEREPGALLAALVRLEIAGAVVRRDDLRYARL